MAPTASMAVARPRRGRCRSRVTPAQTPTVLQRIAQGEAAAVQECIDRHGPLVWALVRRMCPRGADPEDVVQEIFIALWKSAAQYDPRLALESTWVTTLARRRLIDLRRKLARRGEAGEVGEDVPSSAPGQVELAERADESARAAAALAELRAEQRRVLELAVVQGFTYEQVATQLELPLGTVKTHARRGLIRVRELLGLRSGPAGEGASG